MIKFKSKYGDNKLVIIGDMFGHETMRNMGKLQKEKVLESCLKNIIMMYF